MMDIRGLRRWTTVVAVVPLLTVVPPPGFAQSIPGSRVLVMPFAADVEPGAPGGAGASLWLGEAAAVLLGEGLSSLGVGTLTREERVAAFERLQLPMSSALTRATMIRVGELIGASDIVFGDVRFGQTLSVRARLIRLEAGQEGVSVTDTASLDDIVPLFARVASRVAELAGGRVSNGDAVASSLPLEAFESYVKGLVAATPATQQRFLEGALRLAPADPRILLALWSVYAAQNLHDRALAAANAVSATSPLASKARFAVAQSLIALRRLDGAYQELTALYARSPAPAVSNALGVVQLRRGAPKGPEHATTFFARAVREDSNDTTYLFNLGYAHALASNGTEALAWLREVVRFRAADGDAHLVMSAVLAGSGRAAEALRELTLARLLGASLDATSLVTRGSVPSGLERLAASLEPDTVPGLAVAEPAQRDQQETAAFHLDRARALVEQRRDRESLAELRRAIYLAPYQSESHLLLGQVYHRAGQVNEAIEEFKVAIWSRETAAAHLALAAALLDVGDREGARTAVARALVLAPDSTDARELLRRIDG